MYSAIWNRPSTIVPGGSSRLLPAADAMSAVWPLARPTSRRVARRSDAGSVSLEFNQIVVPETGDIELSRDSMIELTGIGEIQYRGPK